MKKIVIAFGLLIVVKSALAQNLAQVKEELYKVNKVFDSSAFLGFDVNINYSSDTLYGKFEVEEMTGKYIVNNRHLYYHMGSIEYIQNDSFVYNIFHDEKMMMMTKELRTNNSGMFPLKEFVDSIITWYDTLYTISIRDEGVLRVIEFVANATSLPYQHFAVYYDSSSHYPGKFAMSFLEPLSDVSDMPDSVALFIKQSPIIKKVTMSFSNYHNPQSMDVFENSKYVRRDPQRKTYRPTVTYKAYRLIANGVNGENPDETVEAYPPQTGGN